MPKGFEAVNGEPPAPSAPRAVEHINGPFASPFTPVEHLWTCPEHKKTNWACRYCAAQAVVEGALVPLYVLEAMHNEDGSNDDVRVIVADQVEANLAEHDKTGAVAAHLFARVATFTRRLAREE
jgi:hypothetical protein